MGAGRSWSPPLLPIVDWNGLRCGREIVLQILNQLKLPGHL